MRVLPLLWSVWLGAFLGIVIALLIATPPATARTRVIIPHTISSEVQSDGTFVPNTIQPVVSDTIEFTNLDWRDSIVPVTTNVGEPCSNVAAYSASSIAGPRRHGPPGIFARVSTSGTRGAGIVTLPTACSHDTSPTVVGSDQWCANQSGVPAGQIPTEVYGYTWVAGVILIIDANQIRPTNTSVVANWDWTILDWHFNQAAWHGKQVIIGLRYGQEGTPQWICTQNGGNVSCGLVEDTNDGVSASDSDCGTEWLMPSVGDADFATHIDETWAGIATHLKTREDWIQALGGIQGVGVNNVSGEFKWPKSCLDSDNDGVLDTIRGDACTCNTYVMAQLLWSDEALKNFVVARINNAQAAFGFSVPFLNPIIQGGYGGVESPTNFDGDSLCVAGTNPANCTLNSGANMLCPACGTTRQIAQNNDNQITGSVPQLEAMIAATQTTDNSPAWWPHYGLGTLALEADQPASSNPSYAAFPNLAGSPPACSFPLALVGPVSQQQQAPNKWANNTTLSPPRPHLNAFQVNNRGGGIDDIMAFESSMWANTCYTNAVQHQFYADMVWEIHQRVGASGEMNPTRDDSPTPAGVDPLYGETKTPTEWASEFRARRDAAVLKTVYGQFAPARHSYTITSAGTTYVTIPRRALSDGIGCSLATITATAP